MRTFFTVLGLLNLALGVGWALVGDDYARGTWHLALTILMWLQSERGA